LTDVLQCGTLKQFKPKTKFVKGCFKNSFLARGYRAGKTPVPPHREIFLYSADVGRRWFETGWGMLSFWVIRRTIYVLLSVLVLMPSGIVMQAFASPAPPCCCEKNAYAASFRAPCGMNHCSPAAPKCPLCPSSNSSTPFIHAHRGAEVFLPRLSFTIATPQSLSDQGFVRSVFRPPASLV
jgi:hypothetical protein